MANDGVAVVSGGTSAGSVSVDGSGAVAAVPGSRGVSGALGSPLTGTTGNGDVTGKGSSLLPAEPSGAAVLDLSSATATTARRRAGRRRGRRR